MSRSGQAEGKAEQRQVVLVKEFEKLVGCDRHLMKYYGSGGERIELL